MRRSPSSSPARPARSRSPARRSAAAPGARLVSRLLDWFVRHARDLPWRRTQDPYAIWISEVMLQQTQVKTVIPFWLRWLADLPDVRSLARAPEAKVLKLWEGLGYYSRARNLQKAAQVIEREHGGQFPADINAVLALPGIGPYTAGAICSIAYNQPAPILDGNVIRVLSRVFAIEGDPRERDVRTRLWELAQELVQQAPSPWLAPTPASLQQLTGARSAFNQSMMELGATICTPATPGCGRCPAGSLCAARRQNRVAEFPQLTPRAKPTARRFVAFVLEREGRWLVRQRPHGVVNGRLWEFPNIEPAPDTSPAEAFVELFQQPAPALAPLGTVRHSITRYRIALEVFAAQAVPLPGKERWRTRPELEALAFSSAHRRILRWLTAPARTNSSIPLWTIPT